MLCTSDDVARGGVYIMCYGQFNIRSFPVVTVTHRRHCHDGADREGNTYTAGADEGVSSGRCLDGEVTEKPGREN